jgi:uncharacterized membrane protein (UPF0127 family)
VTGDAKCILNLTRGRPVCERVLIADRPLQRMRGLLGLGALQVGDGLLLKPAPSVHTAFMRFPIDVVFASRELHVLKLVESMRPWRTAAARRAHVVLELSAGEIGRRGVQIGDVLEITDQRIPRDGRADRPAGTHSAFDRSAARSEDTAACTRVLLITTDRRFRTVAGALLARRGCSVSFGERMVNVAELARREAADVVMLDVGATLTAAARESAQLALLEPPVGVVLVGEQDADGLAALPVIPKWDAFEALYGVVEKASGARWIAS